MKNIVLKKLKVANFMSIGETPIEIDFKTGVNIITGTNKDKTDRRNGVGKSSIADAIFFTMYGSIMRPVKKEAIRNDFTKGTCETSLELDVVSETQTQNVLIVRSLEPSLLHLYIDGVDKTLDSIASTTDFIVNLVGCNSEVFENCIVMTLNSALPFMCRKKNEKRKFIESIFNLEIFSRMLAEAKAEYSTCKAELDVAVGRAEEVEISINTIKNQHKTVAAQKAGKLTTMKQRIAGLEESINNLQTDIDVKNSITAADVNKAKEFLTTELIGLKADYTARAEFLSSEGIEAKTLIHSADEALSKMDVNSDNCPTCLRQVTDDVRIHVNVARLAAQAARQEQVARVARVNKLQKEHAQVFLTISEKETAANGVIEKWENQEKANSKAKQDISDFKVMIKHLQANVAELEKEQPVFEDLSNQQQDKLTEIVAKKTECSSRLNILNQAKFVFSEEGVKSLMVKRILNIFNTQLAYYLQKLDANCSCTFNEYFEETIINDKGREYSYFSLSGAERKSIDLACLFTFMDIRRLQGDVAFNISVFDELFDSSLDAKGVDLVLEVLKDRVEKFNECIYVISHRKESAKLATGEVVYLVKSNGTTTRVDFVDAPHQ